MTGETGSTSCSRWAIVLGNERNLGGCTALRAYRIVHFTLAVALILSGIAAVPAAYGFVLETLLRIEFLLAGCEDERCSAVLAYQFFVLEHDIIPSALDFLVLKFG
jgi:hypothetical protein